MFDLLPAPVNGLLARLRRSLANPGARLAGQSPFFPQGKGLLALEQRYFFDAAGLVTAQDLLPPDLPPEPVADPTVLVFIDSSVQDYETLTRDLPDYAQVILLSPGEDGLARIGETLATRQGVDAVHLVGHGSSGAMIVGGALLDLDTLSARGEEIRAWSHSLSADADILLYGCDVGAGEAGAMLASRLADLTGADVAASDDATGSGALGGDWELERQYGLIDGPVFFAASGWQGVLVVSEGSDYADTWNESGNPPPTLTFSGSTATVTATIDVSDDVDVFEVTLANGGIYQINLDGGTLGDTYLSGVYDNSGNYLGGQNDDSNGTLNSETVYQAAYSGTHYIYARAFSSNTGTYTLTVAYQGGADDYANTYDGASPGPGSIPTLGVASYGVIESAGDMDVFSVSLSSGVTYQIAMTGNGGTPIGDSVIDGVYNGSGTNLGGYNDDYNGLMSTSFFTPNATDTYYVYVRGYGNSTGGYALDVTAQGGGGDDFKDDYAQEGGVFGSLVVDGGAASGTINLPDDYDVFSVTLSGNSTYRLDMTGVTLGDTVIYGVYNATTLWMGSTYNDDANGTLFSSVVFTTPNDAETTYYVYVRGYESNTGTYSLQITTDNDDYRDDYNGAGTLGAVTVDGAVETGSIETPYDVDVYAVDLTYGNYYQFDLYEASTDTPLYDTTILGIYDQYGNYLGGWNDDVDPSGEDFTSQSFFQPWYSGTRTYYVYVGAFGSDMGDYSLSVANYVVAAGLDGATDYADYYGDANYGAITANGGQVWGTIAYDPFGTDYDLFQVNLAANTAYQLRMNGIGDMDANIIGVLDANGSLIYDGNWNYAGANDNYVWWDPNARSLFVSGASGTYTIVVGGAYGATGDYNLEVISLPDPAGATMKSGFLLESAALPWERLAVGTGDRWYEVTLEGGSGSSYPEIIRFWGPDGTLLDWTLNEYETDEYSMVFYAPTAGAYTFGLYDDTGGRFDLKLAQVSVVDANTPINGTFDDEGGALFQVSLEQSRFYKGTLFNQGNDYPNFSTYNPGGWSNWPYATSIDTANDTRSQIFGSPQAGYYLFRAYGLADSNYQLTIGPPPTLTLTAGTGDHTSKIDSAGDTYGLILAQLQADTTYRIRLDGLDTLDPMLFNLIDWTGGYAPSAENDDYPFLGVDSQIYFTPSRTGDYLLVLGASNWANWYNPAAAVGDFTVTVTTASDDYADNWYDYPLNATDPRVGSAFTNDDALGAINSASDVDFWDIALTGGYDYSFSLSDWSNFASDWTYSGWSLTGAPTFLGFYDGYGQLIYDFSTDGYPTTYFSFSPEWSDVYYLAVASYGDWTGAYVLQTNESYPYYYNNYYDDYYYYDYDYYYDDMWAYDYSWDYWDDSYYVEDYFWSDFWGGTSFWDGDALFTDAGFGMYGADSYYYGDAAFFYDPAMGFRGEGGDQPLGPDGQPLGPDGQPLGPDGEPLEGGEEEGQQRGEEEQTTEGEGEGEGENPDQNANGGQPGEELVMDENLINQLRQLGGARQKDIDNILQAVGNLVRCGR